MSWEIYPASRFAEFAYAWDRLNNQACAPPFLRSAFVGRALATFGVGDELIAARGDSGNESAICILRRKSTGIWQTFQPSQLPLGAWLMDPRLTYDEAASDLFARLPGFPVMVGITQQDPAFYPKPDPNALLQTLHYIQTSWIPVDGAFRSYWTQRGKRLRQKMRNQHSKMVRQGIEAALDEITLPDQVPQAIEDYGRLESAGWKGRLGTAISSANRQGEFYRGVLEDFCQLGAGRIFRLRFNEHTVAVELYIEWHGMLVGLKQTYDETINGFSPSSLLKKRAYEQVFLRPDIHRIEFFGPRMEWTARWTPWARPLFHVNVFRNSILRAARAWVSPALVTPNAVFGNQCVHDPAWRLRWSGGSDAPPERADPRIAEGFRGTKRSHEAQDCVP